MHSGAVCIAQFPGDLDSIASAAGCRGAIVVCCASVYSIAHHGIVVDVEHITLARSCMYIGIRTDRCADSRRAQHRYSD